MYLIQLDHIVYRQRDGRAFTLTEALREVYGVGHCRILREDGTEVVADAGSSGTLVHTPTGRRLVRRPATPARLANARDAHGRRRQPGPCLGCGHAQRNHINGHGLCLVRSCRLCLIYRDSAAPAAAA